MTFQIGQRVVCVRDDWSCLATGYLAPVLPRRGHIYTIRSIDRIDDDLYLRLHEIVTPIPPGYLIEPRFWSLGFRPITERRTDISIFTRLLDPTKSPILEDA